MTRSLRLGVVAPLWNPVPPVYYGGIERHLHLLVEELARRGHAVTLFASADSRVGVRLVSVVERGVAETMDAGAAYFYEHYLNASVARALRESGEFDLLHLHLGCAAMPLAALARAPALHTLHTGVTLDDLWILERFPETPLTALSQRQIAEIAPGRRERIRVIPHGFDFDSCAAADGPPRHLAFLGRMAAHKGPDAAIRLARAVGRPLHLAGAPVTPDDRAWFARHVEPEIDGRDVIWLGPVDDAGKDELFRGAAALVYPIAWEEPFGLVMLEALARGVPVLATRRGSVPEVVEPGVTGFMAETPEALARDVEAAARLERKGVRERARHRFSLSAMVDAYEAAYAAARVHA